MLSVEMLRAFGQALTTLRRLLMNVRDKDDHKDII